MIAQISFDITGYPVFKPIIAVWWPAPGELPGAQWLVPGCPVTCVHCMVISHNNQCLMTDDWYPVIGTWYQMTSDWLIGDVDLMPGACLTGAW